MKTSMKSSETGSGFERPTRVSPLNRFRSVVRRAVANFFWMEEVEILELGDDVLKNVKKLLRRRGLQSALDQETKLLLFRDPETRSERDIETAFKGLEQLSIFKKYPVSARRAVATTARYAYYGPNRVIIRQHHKPENWYIILNGEVKITKELELRSEPETKNVVICGKMGKGDTFGEVALLYHMERSATVTTNAHCEFLVINCNIFRAHFYETVMRDWNRVIGYIKGFNYFTGWKESIIREMCIYGILQSFPEETVILGDGQGRKNYVYFLISGECRIAEHVLYTTARGKPQLLQPERVSACSTEGLSSGLISGSKSSSDYLIELPKYVKACFMQVCILKPGMCFGLGEHFENRRVITISPVKLMLLPRLWLLHQYVSQWHSILFYLNSNIPTTEVLFHKLLKEKKWRAHKEKLLKDCYRRNFTPNTKYNDVPYSIRIQAHDDLRNCH